MTSSQYSDVARGWSGHAYADTRRYLSRRAQLVRTLGPVLEPGDVVLDLACGDGGFGAFLPGLRYVGVDENHEMVAEGRAHGVEIVEADLNGYVPAERVQATTMFRALYYVRDRPAFFRAVAAYTEKKLVFDVNPRQYPLAGVRAELLAAGFTHVDTRPFFVPQTHALPAPIAALLALLERTPVAHLLLRVRFTLLCAASAG